jgi:hypothetical protein
MITVQQVQGAATLRACRNNPKRRSRGVVLCCAEEPAETIQEGTELSTSVSLASTGGLDPAAAASAAAAGAADN